MLKKDSHINLIVFSVLAYGLLLEMFFILPSLMTVILGYFVVFAFVFLHYDLHTTFKKKYPFKSAYLENSHLPWFERHGLSLMEGLSNRFSYLFHKDHRGFHFHLMIQPTFLYWGSASLILLFVNPLFGQFVIIVSTAIFMILMANISSIYQKELVIADHHLHLLGITKIVIVFLCFMATYGYYELGFIGVYNLLALSLSVTLVMIYNYAWKSGQLFKKEYAYLGVIFSGLFTVLVAYLCAWFDMNYYVAVVALYASYYFSFGIMKHYLKGDLTKKIVLEYLIASVLLIAFIWSNNYFGEYIL